MGFTAKKSHRIYTSITQELHDKYKKMSNDMMINDYDLFKIALSEWILKQEIIKKEVKQ
jgi:hypothetical protein